MKITFIAGLFPKLSETFVMGQVTSLLDKGHDVNVVSTLKPEDEVIHEDVNKYGLIGRTIYIEKSPSSLGFVVGPRLLESLVFTDLIHAHFATHPADWALRLSEMFSIPFVITAHAYDIFINPDVEKLREKFSRAAKVITVSDYNRDYLINLLGRDLQEKIEVVRCGIDLERFIYSERGARDSVKILFVGRFVEKKGARYAVEAFTEVVKECPNTEIRMIGDGPLKDDIATLVERLGIKDKVSLLGPLSANDVLKEMKDADIFFLPSVTADNGDKEGIPVSIMEAMATGLPVVSTLHTGIPELVAHGKTGFLVPEKDTLAMAGRLNELIRDPDLRVLMGREGRAVVEASYNRSKEIERVERLFAKLLVGNIPVSALPGEQREIIRQRVMKAGGLLKELDKEIKDKDKELAEKKRLLTEREQQVQKILNSMSWRITAPLRFLSSFLKR